MARKLLILTVLFIGASAPSYADDASYCRALAAEYQKYYVKLSGHSPRPGPIDGNIAADQCDRPCGRNNNGQFNTTIYSHDDRFRGIYGTRRVILMHRDDMQRLGFADGDIVMATCAVVRGGETAREV